MKSIRIIFNTRQFIFNISLGIDFFYYFSSDKKNNFIELLH